MKCERSAAEKPKYKIQLGSKKEEKKKTHDLTQDEMSFENTYIKHSV